MEPEHARWGISEHLLAGVFDGINVLAWQNSGGKGKRPKPFPRPGIGPATRKLAGGGKTYTIAELKEHLATRRG
jgi:hypothetical protein